MASAHSADGTVAVLVGAYGCYLDGFFAYPHPPSRDSAPTTTFDPHGDRAVLLIRSDGSELDLFVGPVSKIPIERPGVRTSPATSSS